MSRIVNVYTNQDLADAVSDLQAGDEVRLASGSYQSLDLEDLSFDPPVTFTSMDVANPATITDKNTVENCSGFVFDNLVFQLENVPNVGANYSSNAVLNIVDSSNITIQNTKIAGKVSDIDQGDPLNDKMSALIVGYPSGVGVQINRSSDVNIIGSELCDLYNAVWVRDTENVKIHRSNFHDIRTDAMQGADQVNTEISENLFSRLTPWKYDPDNFSGATDDHCDFIQYYGSGSNFGVHGFYVRDNVFIQPEDTVIQTIFGRLGLTGSEPEGVSLTDFEVTGNLIYNSCGHGISISGVEGALIQNNTLVPNTEVMDYYKNVPGININYDGPYPTHGDFDLYDDYTSQTVDLEIRNNLGSNSWNEGVQIKAYRKGQNELTDVLNHLRYEVTGNQFIDSPKDTPYEFADLWGMEVDTSLSEVEIYLNPDDFVVSTRVGSEYYYNADKLNEFLGNLRLERTYTVTTSVVGELEDIARLQTEDVTPLHLTASSALPALEPAHGPDMWL